MKNLARLNPYFWKYRGRFALGIFFIVLSNVFNVYAPILVGEGIDFLTNALGARETITSQGVAQIDAPSSIAIASGWIGKPMDAISLTEADFAATVTKIGLLLAVGYILFYLLKGVFLFFQRQTIIVMSRHIEYDLKNEIYDQYQRLDASFYRRNRTGDLMNRISEDVSRVRMYLGPAVMYTINLIVLIVMCVVVMWQISPELTLYTLSPLPFMAIGIFYVSTIINRRTERAQQQQSALSSMVQESVSGIRLVRAYSRESYFVHTFAAQSNDYKQKQLRLVKADALFMPVIVILVGLSTILTLYVGSKQVIAGELSYGVIVQFVFYVNQLTWPFASVGWVSSLVQKAEASQERINEFLNAKPTVSAPSNPMPFTPGALKLENVSFTYPESGVQALKNVSFDVPFGSTVAIVGRTGSGKSTVASLLMRIYDPTAGRIEVDGKSIQTVDIKSLRDAVGYVPQDVFLFSESIGENIAFGSAQATQEQIEHAARIADVHDTILGFPNGYDTLLGERGINLSGGQKQRVAIARAILRSAPFIILDDCLSAVDTDTEERILAALHTYRKNRTTVIIAHRLTGVRHADQIIVLDHGKVAEQGSHDELIAMNGLYASMWKRQQPDEAA
jgi:ATP-binding cassette, subfamily B, multidrug efflux pump